MSPLFPKDYWRRFKDDYSKKSQSESEKHKSSTQNKRDPGKTGKPGKNVPSSTQNKRDPGKSGKSGKNVPGVPEIPASPRFSVDDSKGEKE